MNITIIGRTGEVTDLVSNKETFTSDELGAMVVDVTSFVPKNRLPAYPALKMLPKLTLD